jgi:hypothetical protein
MSILDDAIREHLELKRAHGADEAELKRLEDEAFGPPGRPEEDDPFAEAPTEFLATPEVPGDAAPAEESGRRINIADLQEPPPPERAAEREEPQVEAIDAIEPEAEATPLAPAEDPAQAAPPAEEPPLEDEPQAMEHEVVVEPAEDAPAQEAPAAVEPTPGAETEERHAIAEQPTELFDIEAEMGTEDAPAAEPTEIQASRTEAPAPPLPEEDEEDEEFWSEQRLSDELDQALEAPLTDEPEVAPRTEVHQVPAPPAEPSAPVDDDEDEEDDAPRPDYDPDTGHEDVLEDTPDFLEDAPEDDELWFEQKPPKDFDLD